MKTGVLLLAAPIVIFAIGVIFSNAQQEKPKAKVAEISIGGQKMAERRKEAKVIDFTLINLAGKEVRLSEFSKGKVLLLKFGTIGIPASNMEITVMNKIVEAYGDKVAVLEVDVVPMEFPQMKPEDRNVEKAIGKIKEHARSNKKNYTIVLDKDGKVAEDYGVRGIPYVIVAGGNKVVQFDGYAEFSALKTAIDGLLGGDKKADDKKAEEKK